MTTRGAPASFRNTHLLLATVSLVCALCVTGCTSSAAKTERSDSILATGQAFIEGIKEVGLTVTHLFVLKIDGQLQQAKGTKGVYPLTPGPHALQVQCNFSRVPVTGPIIDAGGTVLQLDAQPGVRYRLAGKKLSHTEAELWIENVQTGRPATPPTRVALEANRREMPVIPVYIPAK